MKRFVIRHGATGVKRDERKAFGVQGPPIDELGQKQAAELKKNLIKLGIDPSTEPVAVSNFLRTRQTAEFAGFTNIQARPVLDEIFTGIPGEELRAMLEVEKLPLIVLERAQAILDNPPKEKLWITHGLVIMGLKQLLSVKADSFDPPNCEILEIDF